MQTIEEELCHVHTWGKALSPGDDGITYAVLHLLLQVPGNSLPQLYSLRAKSKAFSTAKSPERKIDV